MKIILPIFNRATYGRLQPLIDGFDKSSHDLTVVLAGSVLKEEFENAQSYIKENHPHTTFSYLPVVDRDGSERSMGETVSEILFKMLHVVDGKGFDLALVVGDRFETSAASLAFALTRLPQAHLQGGEITGNIDEKIRHVVTMLSDYHMTTTDLAQEYVKQLGQHPNRVRNTGCPSTDLIWKHRITRNSEKKDHFICIFHPHTNELELAEEQMRSVLMSCLDFASKHEKVCYVYPPNPDPGRIQIKHLCEETITNFPKWLAKGVNKPPEQFLKHLNRSLFIIGNSSCGLREASYLGVPAINVGLRQGPRERSWNVVDVGFESDDLIAAMEYQKDIKKYKRSHLYGSGNSVKRIIQWIDDIDPEIKGSLMYPYWIEYVDKHTGGKRFENHGKKRRLK